MSIQDYPRLITIYRGEGRILIIPILKHIGGYRRESDWYICLPETADCEKIGESILLAIDFIDNSPLSVMTSSEYNIKAAWKNNTKYKSWASFWKNNDRGGIIFFEEGHYRIYSEMRAATPGQEYGECIKVIDLPALPTTEEIGQSVVDVFEAAEAYYKNGGGKADPYPPIEISLLDKAQTKLTIHPPRDRHFEDSEDCGTGEIYQCYSYIAREGDEPSGYFALTMGPKEGLLDSEKIQEEWEGYYGKSESFTMEEKEKGIFTHFAKMRNKKIHLISYFLRLEEDLILGCEMSLYQPNKRKKLDEKLQTMFEDFVLGCQRAETAKDD